VGTAAAVTALHVGIGMALLSTFAGGWSRKRFRDALPTCGSPHFEAIARIEPKAARDKQEIKIPTRASTSRRQGPVPGPMTR
jgi:protein TonB